jgi:preprotein translocase subunit SecE
MKIKRYIQESFTELFHKVTWPTWSELQNSAVLVMAASLVIALVVAGMDLSFEKIMDSVYKLLYKV